MPVWHFVRYRTEVSSAAFKQADCAATSEHLPSIYSECLLQIALAAGSELLHAALGLQVRSQPIDCCSARQYDIPNEGAAEVLQTFPDGPSERAGLRAGDRIVSIDCHIIEGIDDLGRALSQLCEEVSVPIRILRGNFLIERSITPTSVSVNQISSSL